MGRNKPTYTTYPPSSTDSVSKTLYKGEEPVDELDTEVSLAGSQFAQFILDKAKFEAAENAAGLNVPRKKEVKQYPAFRNTFFGDTRYTPALAYTHLCYEFDAQFGEMEKHWSRAGKKFSDEPARGKPQYSAENGPKKPVEWLKYAEKETRVYGAKRRIMPFSTSKKYTAPLDRCTLPYKPTPDEAVSHLGPGAYKVPDPWRQRSGDGNVAGTQAFLSRSRGVANKFNHWDRLYQDEPTMVPERAASRTSHQQITGSLTRVRTPADFSRSVISQKLTETQTSDSAAAISTQSRSVKEFPYTDEKQYMSEVEEKVISSTDSRPNSHNPLKDLAVEAPESLAYSPKISCDTSAGSLDEMNDSMMELSVDKKAEATGEMQLGKKVSEGREPDKDREAHSLGASPHRPLSRPLNTMSSRADTHTHSRTDTKNSSARENPALDFLNLGTKDRVQSLQYLSSSMSDPQLFKFLVHTQFKKNSPGQHLASGIEELPRGAQPPRRPMSVQEQRKIPGVTMCRGKPGKSSLDIITGSTDADKKYRRLKLKDGSKIIYKMDKDSNAQDMPDGAEFTDDWAVTNVYAEKTQLCR